MNAPQGFIPPDDLPLDDESSAAGSREQLVGMWTVDGVHGEGGMLQPTTPGTGVSISFEADGSLSGRSGSNSFSGAWDLDAGRLRLSNVTMAAMGSRDDDATEQEGRLLAALPLIVAFDVAGAHHRGALELIDEHGRALIRATRE
jgi:heat shock protein HslJ